jgi:hypothetical protein
VKFPVLLTVSLSALAVGCGGSRGTASDASNVPEAVPVAGSALHTLFSPWCDGSPDLEPSLRGDGAALAAAARTLRMTTPELSLDAWNQGASLPRSGYFATFIAGHAKPGLQNGSICIDPDGAGGAPSVHRTFDKLASQLPAGLKGAVFILSACMSARVDPREAKVPLSTISASPFVVDTDALFGQVVPEALTRAAQDPNCDGLITDQELFDQISLLLAQRPVVSFRPAFPKLRRNATSEIPLPLAPLASKACDVRKREITKLVRDAVTWGALGEGMRAQQALSERLLRPDAPALPSSTADYYVLRPLGDPELERKLHVRLQAGGLAALPPSAVARAEEIASFIIFAQVYEVSEQCGWLQVRRLKDGAVLSIVPVDKAELPVPKRAGYEFSAVGTSSVLWRSVVVDDKSLIAVPCFSEVGQCFEPPTIPQDEHQ